MPHIPGHIITPPSSCGVLRMDNSDVKMFHLPSDWKMVEDDEVGFFPMTMNGIGVNSVLAINVYRLEDYDAVERWVKLKCRPHLKAMEELASKPKLLKKVKSELNHSKLTITQKEILKKTLTYFKTRDFKKFYNKPHQKPVNVTNRKFINFQPINRNKPSTNSAHAKICSIMS